MRRAPYGRALRIAVLALLALAAATAAGCRPKAREHMADMANFRFAPDPITIRVGDRITWVNRDATPHNVTQGTPQQATKGFLSPNLNQNEKWTYTFTQAGTFDIYCSVPGHFELGMAGKVIVQGR